MTFSSDVLSQDLRELEGREETAQRLADAERQRQEAAMHLFQAQPTRPQLSS